MLVLSRNKGQVILIGNDIRITITDIHSHQVKVGIEAPKEVNIVREEIANGPDPRIG